MAGGSGEMPRGRGAHGHGLVGHEPFSSDHLHLPSPRALKRMKIVITLKMLSTIATFFIQMKLPVWCGEGDKIFRDTRDVV